ncbi:tetratricopeptide repeat protein, partial [Thermodesulfobacteriota bacterium]
MTDHNTAMDRFKKGAKAFAEKDFKTGVDEFTKSIAMDPAFGLAYASRGAAFMKLNRLEESLADFGRAIELEPDRPGPYHLRGLVREKLGDHEGALADFGTAIDLNPDYSAAYVSRAALQIKLGKDDLATEDVQMIHALTEKNIQDFSRENNIWR